METVGDKRPDLLKQAHVTLNSAVQLDRLGAKAIESNTKLWWQCQKDPSHIWSATVRSRAFNNQGCPICDDKLVLTGYNDLATKYPSIASEWHSTLNTDMVPTGVTYKTDRKVWWECPKGHEYPMSVRDRTVRGRGCSVCRGLRVVVGVNDLSATHPEVAAEWHPTKNVSVNIAEITAGSHQKVWWLGGNCGHEWEMVVHRRTQSKPQGCSVCAGKVIIESTSLAASHPEIAVDWHPTKNGSLTPQEVLPGSHQKVWWLGECGHEWDAIVKSRTLSGYGCPVCSGKRVIAHVNSLATIFPTIAQEWHPTLNGNLLPDQVSSASGKKIWWQCKNKGHVWRCSVGNRTGLKSNCPDCVYHVSAGEQELFDYVKSLGFNPERNRTVLGTGQELDVYIPEKNLAIEFNELYWHSEAQGKTETYHYDKWKAAKDKGIQLFQVWEDDYKRKPELIKRMIAYKLGVSDVSSIPARKTVFQRIRAREAEIFLEENHLQGYRSAKHFGLFYEEKLVALVGVGVKGNVMEIIRFSSNSSVPGGFSKLLKNVLALPEFANVTDVISYSHNDHSNGGLYEATGFELVHEGKPGYAYVVNGERVHRLQYTKKRFREDPALFYEDGLTERQLAEFNKLTRIWDAGSSLWKRK